MFLGTHVIARQLAARLGLFGYASHAFQYTPGAENWVDTEIGHDTITTPVSVWRFVNAGGFLSSPETWIGVAVGVALHRLRHPIAHAAHRDLTAPRIASWDSRPSSAK